MVGQVIEMIKWFRNKITFNDSTYRPYGPVDFQKFYLHCDTGPKSAKRGARTGAFHLKLVVLLVCVL